MKKNNPKTTQTLAIILGIIIIICAIIGIISLIAGDGTMSDILHGATKEPTITSAPDETIAPKNTAEPIEKPTDEPENTSEPTVTSEPEKTAEPTNEPTAEPTATATPEPTKTPETEDKTVVSKVSVLAAGDNLFHNGIMNEAKSLAEEEGEGKDFTFDYIYEDVKEEIQSADISIINQESLILPKHYLSNNISKYIRSDGSFVAPEELMQTLVDLGFDVQIKANNHMLDMSSAGMKWGIDYCNTVEEILSVGAYYTEEDSETVRILEKNGIKIAFLAYTYDTNVPQSIATSDDPTVPYYIPLLDEEKMVADLKRANEVADFTIVSVHWGNELEETPNDEQRRIAKILAENGAGIIIGHHSHCLQPIEYVDDGKGGKIICAYSLGTLVSNMAAEKNMLAGFLEFNIVKYSDGSIEVTDCKLNPTVFYYDMNYKNSRLVYLNDITEEMCASHGIGNYPKNSDVKNTMSRASLYTYLRRVIDGEFLPDLYRE